MRGESDPRLGMFSNVSLEERVPKDHSIRKIRRVVDKAISTIEPQLEALYASNSRPSVSPERLIRAQLLQIIYSILSERQLVERINYDLLFRWLVGLDIDERVWDHSRFTKTIVKCLGTAEFTLRVLGAFATGCGSIYRPTTEHDKEFLSFV